MKRGLAAAACGLLLLAVGGPASAERLVFDVEIQTLNGAAIAPVHFQQTWTFSSIATHDHLFNNADGSTTQVDRAQATGAYTDSPVTMAELADVGMSGLPRSATLGALTEVHSTAGVPDGQMGNFIVSNFNEVQDDLGNGTFLDRTYTTNINGGLPFLTADQRTLTGGELFGLLLNAPTFHWIEWATSAIHDPSFNNGQGSYTYTVQDAYSGVAVFNSLASDVPEPAPWALLIVAFGMSGVALRRSRRAPIVGA